MKIFILFSVLLLPGLIAISQQRVKISNELQDYGVKVDKSYYQTLENHNTKAPYKNSCFLEEDVGTTCYDLQTSASMQKRIHVFDDGTIGTVWTMGYDYVQFLDRGTGYNYYDGENWGPIPTEPLESDRTGWPAYAPYGENGEIIVSHLATTGEEGLMLLKRENKGIGDWEELNFIGPPGCENIIWSRIATGGTDNSIIHLLAVTAPASNCSVPYQGQEVAILYSRSFDGGNSWDPENYIIPLIDSSHYKGFNGDVYNIRADGDNVGILIGDSWIDLLLLKSTDNGDSWEKTIIWEHPYPLWTPGGNTTDTFYCVDGAHSLDFDNNGMAHVVFGINKTVCDGASTYWFPAVGGIGYWNENRPSFSNNLNALNPYGHPDSELEEDYSLIGWTQDINGNGQLDILDDWGNYSLGFSSMPQISVDDLNRIFVVYSSVTETYDNGIQSYRHLWGRYSSNGNSWSPFLFLTNSLCHCMHENVFPSLATHSDGWLNYYLSFQYDPDPGLAVRGDHPFNENIISFMEVDVITEIEENRKTDKNLKVSQNVPNPFKDKTKVQVELFEANNVSIEIVNLTGQKVLTFDQGYLQPGSHLITINAKELNPGMYFYIVKAGDNAISKKMLVE